tara:strand:+ start:1653 stop:2099 length:447 start_codon:yes stop_codon:yes gene_type:complete
MERIISWKEKILRGPGDHHRSRGRRLGHWLVVIAGCACAVGCSTIKKAAVVGAGTLGVGALVSTVTSGTAPVLLGTAGTASVLTAGADLLVTPKGKNIMNESCAPDNLFTALGDLVSVAGWGIVLIILVPMIFSWLLPGPVKFKSKKD